LAGKSVAHIIQECEEGTIPISPKNNGRDAISDEGKARKGRRSRKLEEEKRQEFNLPYKTRSGKGVGTRYCEEISPKQKRNRGWQKKKIKIVGLMNHRTEKEPSRENELIEKDLETEIRRKLGLSSEPDEAATIQRERERTRPYRIGGGSSRDESKSFMVGGYRESDPEANTQE